MWYHNRGHTSYQIVHVISTKLIVDEQDLYSNQVKSGKKYNRPTCLSNYVKTE